MGTQVASFSTGRHSKYLPAELDRLYQEALTNPDLVEMSDHIALLEARMNQVLALAKEGEPAPRWQDLADAFATVETHLLSGDLGKFVPALEAFHKVLDAGMKWDTTWSQVIGIMEQLRKMADTEIKRKKELNQMVPVERVVILMAALGTAVKRHVKDPEQIAAVYRELAVLHGADHTPDGKQVKLVGPEVVDIGPQHRGLKGGRSSRALARKARQRVRDAQAAGDEV